MNPLVLLRLIPLKDWFYIALIAGLLATFGWYTHHQRNIGAQKIETRDEKARTDKVKVNEKVGKQAADEIRTAETNFDVRIHATPTGPIPHLVCNSADDSGGVSDRANPSGKGDDSATDSGLLSQEGGAGFNPSPEVMQLADEADTLSAELELAQATIRAYQKQGLVQK